MYIPVQAAPKNSIGKGENDKSSHIRSVKREMADGFPFCLCSFVLFSFFGSLTPLRTIASMYSYHGYCDSSEGP